MKELGIRACWVKPYTVTTISEDFSDKLRNVLKRNFDPTEPNAVWCTDITYLWTDEGFLHLSCIMDLFSRRIVSWELSRTLETEHVIRAIDKALFRNAGVKPKIVHTDRGVQYTSDLYREYLKMQQNVASAAIYYDPSSYMAPNSAFSELAPSVNGYVKDTILQMIVGARDVGEWDDFVEEYREMGGDELEAMLNEWWAENKDEIE